MNPMESRPANSLQAQTAHSPLPAWSAVMRLAVAAHRSGQLLTAMAFYRQGLDLARRAQSEASPGISEDAVPALVASSEGLASLNEEQGRPDLAARVWSELHQTLLQLVQTNSPQTARGRAALRCSHDSHSALMALAETYGWSPPIDTAVRAGCLKLRLPPITVLRTVCENTSG